MPSGHTETETINERRSLTDNMRATLQRVYDCHEKAGSIGIKGYFRHTQANGAQKNALRALLDRGLIDWNDEHGFYFCTRYGREVLEAP
jgi:hypothetical protein